MKKISYLLIMLIFFVTLASCQFEKSVDFELEGPTTVLMGDDSLSDFKLKINNKETIDLTQDMLVNGSEFAFYNEGTQKLVITYKNVTKTFEITVSRRDFKDITFASKEVKYTGEKVKIEVTGNIPQDATIWYKYGNEFTEVGEYTVTAVISAPYYNTLELNALLTITQGGDLDE